MASSIDELKKHTSALFNARLFSIPDVCNHKLLDHHSLQIFQYTRCLQIINSWIIALSQVISAVEVMFNSHSAEKLTYLKETSV